MPQIHFHFITLFPETIEVWLKSSILGRAHKAGIFEYELIQLRDYSTDKHRSVDDVAYGGGGGMVLRVEPLVAAVEQLTQKLGKENTLTIYFSPAGKKLAQTLIQDLSSPKKPKHFIFVCGHYEGVDQRFIDHWVNFELSLGDFVLTGGELPAVATADALIRQCEGTLGSESTAQTESFTLNDSTGPLLEYPHYTRPNEFRGHKVPEVLLSGNHQHVELWRLAEAKRRTVERRPDLFVKS